MSVTASKSSGSSVAAVRLTDPETLEPQDPGDGALHDPAVPAQVGLGLDSAPGDPDLDASPVQVAAAPRVVVALVRVQLLRPAAGPPRTPSPATHTRVGLQQRLEEFAVVDVCG